MPKTADAVMHDLEAIRAGREGIRMAQKAKRGRKYLGTKGRSFSLTFEQLEWLGQTADACGVSKSEVVRDALEHYRNHLEK